MSGEIIDWFRCMFHCPNCCTAEYGYKLCPVHADEKKNLFPETTT